MIDERITNMRRLLIPLTLALFAISLVAVQAASAKGTSHRIVRGACTQQSTSKLELSRDDRGIEVEFQVDENRNSVPWQVTLRRNGAPVASFAARTHAPSGSFDLRRTIKSRSKARITVTATRSGETCRAAAAAPKRAGTVNDDPPAHDLADDNGRDSGGHH